MNSCIMKRIGSLVLAGLLLLSACSTEKESVPPGELTADDPAGRTVITLDIYNLNFVYAQELARHVTAFNQNNPDYFVEFITYDDMEFEDFYTARSLKLITGRGADIYYLAGDYRMSAYIEKGVLEDLSGYIERDLDPEDYLDNVFDIYRKDDGIYAIPMMFTANFLTGKKEMFGEGKDISFQDISRILEEVDPPCLINDLSKQNTLWWFFVAFGMDASDPEELRKGLELAERYYGLSKEPEDHIEGKSYLGEHMLLSNMMFSGPFYIVNMRSEGDYGEDYIYVNKPILTSMPLGIDHASKNREGAWEFLKFLLSEERQRAVGREPGSKDFFQYGGAFMANKKVFMENMDEFYDHQEKQYDIPREETGLRFLELVAGCLRDGEADELRVDYGAWLIIREEAEGYFDGAKGIDETIDAIEGRLKVYLAE